MKQSFGVFASRLRNPRGTLKILLAPRKVWLALLFLAVVTVQAWVHAGATNVGRPYESWDEITLHNSAYVMSGPTFDRGFRYGSLNNVLQWAAIVTYEYFDPIGRAYSHVRYANNVPESWDNPKLAFGPKTWALPMDYTVFRGQDDREPIFISRGIHLFIVYALVLTFGLFAIAWFGITSLYVLVPLLAFTAAPVMYFQMTQSLPNAINAMLSFGVMFFALLYCDSGRRRFLLISVALFGIAMNFKLDAMILAGAPGLALCYALLRRGMLPALTDFGWGALTGMAALAAGKPLMLLNPISDLRVRYHTLFDAAAGSAYPGYDLPGNWEVFLSFLNSSLLWHGAGNYSGLVLATLLALAALVIGIFAWRGKALMLVIGAILVILSWPVIVWRMALPEDHLLLNGLGIFLATVAIAFVLADRAGARWRVAAKAGVAALAILWLGHIAGLNDDALAAGRSYAATQGLDPAHNRTRASLDSVKVIRDGGFSSTVLVDQHSYIDLRVLRLQGVDARYVNMNDFDAVARSLDPSQRHLVIFARGDFNRGDEHLRNWEGEVTPQFQANFLAYQKRLLRLPVKRHYPGAPQPILSVAPINPSDEVFVSVLNP